MDLTNEDVTDILALLDSLPYDELDLQTSRFRLVLRRTPDGWAQSIEVRGAADALNLAASAAPPVPAAPAVAERGAAVTGTMGHRTGPDRDNGPSSRLGSEAEGAGEAEEGLVAVRAPLPGTFYRAPRPGAAPFVEAGSRVGAEDVVGIVETMKLMNSVTAGVDGTVAEICLGNAEFAANGATLLRIRAD
jgi:acetyl-CoA carboxylase biotin carboxyl carrier protein